MVALGINGIKTSAIIPSQNMLWNKRVFQKTEEVGHHKIDEREIFRFRDRGIVKLLVLWTKVSAHCQHCGSSLTAVRHARYVTASLLDIVGQSQRLAAFI